MINFKYSFQGLSKRITFTLLAVVQLSISFLLLYSSIYFNGKLQEGNNKVLALFNNKIIFTLQNNEDYYEDLFKTDGEDKYIEYRKFLESSSYFTHVSYDSSYLLLKNFSGSEKFLNTSNFSVNKNNNKYVPVRCLTIGDNYIKYFPLKVSKGKIFSTDDFDLDSQTEIIPILLGSKYSVIYKLGDILDYVDKVTNSIKKVKIIGFLSPNQYFTSASLPLNNIAGLDNYVVFPQDKIKKLQSDDTQTMISYNSNYRMRLYNSIVNSAIIINNKKDEGKAIKELESKSKDLHFFDMKAINTQKQMDNYISMYKEQNTIINTLFFIVFGICSIGIVSNMLYSIAKRYNDYAVHILNGASIYDIIARVFYEVVLLIGISTIFCCLGIKFMDKIGFASFETYTFIKLIGIIIVLTIIIAFFPIMHVSRIKTNDLLRRLD